MKILITLAVLLLATFTSFGQGTQPIRNQFTTNNSMNAPSDGWIAIWNNVAKKWSNGVNTASATNAAQPPSTVLSNLTTTGVSPGATNAGFYVGSASGKGTNIDFYGLTEVFNSLLVSSNVVATNGAFIQTGGGTAAKFQGALQFTSLGGHISDSNNTSRIDINYGGDVSLNGSNASPGLTLDKNGNGTFFGHLNVATNLFVTNSAKVGSLTSVGAAVFQNTVEVQGLGTGRRALFIDQNNIVQARADVDDTELSFLDGVTSGIQAQIDAIGGGSVDPTNAVLSNIIGTGAKTNSEVIFVDEANGSDVNVGSFLSPIRNINTAAFRTRGNGTVIMEDGFYHQNPNWGLWTNLVLRSMNPGMVTNILGTNISAFTTIGGGTYRVTAAASMWVAYTADGNGFIWQLGSNSFDTFISPTEGHPSMVNRDYYLNGMVHLDATNSIANLQNGYYTVSNAVDIYFKFADGGVPNNRTIQLPALQTTNSFGIGGQLYSSIEMIGIHSFFGNCGTVSTGTKSFKDKNCWFVGNYAEGKINDTMWGVDESDSSVFMFNSNDGVGYTSLGTNVYTAKFINPLVVGNQDGGIDVHNLASCIIDGGMLARQRRGAGSTAFGGGKVEARGTRFYFNQTGAYPSGGGVYYDATRTNFYSTFICDNCTFISNTFGCFLENGTTNVLLRLKGTTTFIGNGNNIANYIDGVNQRLEEEGVIITDTPLLFLHLGSNNNPPTKSTALYVVSASPSSVTIGNTNVTVQTLQVTGINTNGILYTGASGQVSTAALSGLTFSGGVLTATGGGSGGTNFPNVNLLLGNTNLVLVSGVAKSFRQSTNANNYVNLNLAVPDSGYDVTITHTNSGATNYNVTFYTNGVAANFYSIVDKTNATSWTVSAGSVVSQHFIFFNGQWMRTDVEEPLLSLAAGANTTFTTNGQVLTIASSGSGGTGGGAQVTNVSLFSGTSTNLIIDLGLASTNHVVFTVGMLTNSHIVLSNALLRKFPVSIVWQQDTNGNRSILSLRSTDGLIQTNGLPLTLTTNLNAMDIWQLSAAYFPSNVVVDVGIGPENIGPVGNSGDIQFVEGGAFAGTNKFNYDRTNFVFKVENASGTPFIVTNGMVGVGTATPMVKLTVGGSGAALFVGTGGSTNMMDSSQVGIYQDGTFGFMVNNLARWAIDGSTANYPLRPVGSNNNDFGTWSLPVRTNYANDFVAKETVYTPALSVGPGPFQASITNILGTNISLDFPSTAAGTVSDLIATISGVTSNNCAVLFSVPWQSSSASGVYSHFESNNAVYIRFANNNLVTAMDPNPGTFSILVFKQQ